nr:hypothetical protein [Desulfatirhabdium butyrativorans]
MGVLGHFLETEGLPTTQISLIREHTQIIRPPRALWVPFDLGRPLGEPLNADLQHRVMLAALKLLESSEGPVLEDFPDEGLPEIEEGDQEPTVLACPISFRRHSEGMSEPEMRIAAFQQEVAEFRNWYDLNLQKTKRTTVTHFDPESVCELLCTYASGGSIEDKTKGMSPGAAIRIAAQDLKAFYFEALMAQPGTKPVDGKAFQHWFWNETAAADLLKDIRKKCLEETDRSLKMTGKMLLIPLDQG